MEPERYTFLIVSTPSWLLAAIVGWLGVEWLEAPWWAAVALVGLWVLKDLLLYPSMRHYYRAEPVEGRMVGERGVAMSPLDPVGFVKVRGENWQARAAGEADLVHPGTRISVCAVQGMLLIVERELESTGHQGRIARG